MSVSSRPPSPTQIAVLVAMTSRRSRLYATETSWRVRGWGRPIAITTVEGLVDRGLLRWTTTAGRPTEAEITDEGRRVAAGERRAA
jgi:hypothetical protein